MSNDWNWPGSRWWRIDLHAHSAASYDFKPEQERTSPDWGMWLEAARDSGLHAVACTDHNTSAGIQPLQSISPSVTGAPILFPGVEITANDGTHLLLLLDPACNYQHIDELLSKAQIPVDQRGLDTARSPLSVEQLLDLECDRGMVVVAAHVNGPSGLLEHDGQQRIKELRHICLAGVEVVPGAPIDPTWLDGSRPEVPRVIPQLWGSDSHSRPRAGERFTWAKMTRPNLDGLRLAILDGVGSLTPAIAAATGNPNKHADLAIESITVAKAKYVGRPMPLTIALNPWLNTLIGGRGTGKSTIIDLCRAALRRESELPDGDDASLRAAFEKRMRVPSARTEEGLLTADTNIEVTYRKDGERFVLTWEQGTRSTSVVRLDGAQRVPEEGDVRERFPVRIYSQKQLFDLARDPNSLFAVIDDATTVRAGELRKARSEAETKFLSLRAQARSLRAQAKDLPSRRASLADVRRKVKVLEDGGHAAVLSEYRLRHSQSAAWIAAELAASESVAALKDAKDRLNVPAMPGLDATADPAVGHINRAHSQAVGAIERLKLEVTQAIAVAEQELQAVATGHDLANWRQVTTTSDSAYNEVTAQLAQVGIANPDEYKDLLDRVTVLEREIVTLEAQDSSAAQLDTDAHEQLGRFRELRQQLTDRRVAFAGSASNALIRVEIRGGVEHGGLEAFLRETLGIPRFEDDYELACARIKQMASQGTWTYSSLDSLSSDLRRLLDGTLTSWPTKDHRFETALRKLQPERVDRLALYSPDDRVDVSFSEAKAGSTQWRSLAQGSPGQQTAALLAFVLGYGTEPIVFDQPEDDLDNTLIYEMLVRRLRDSKQNRQIIVVTHNPNIVVHGDADLVVSLEAANGQTRIRFSGGLQEQDARDEVCRVMEGGRVAFDTRYRRITQFGTQP